MTRTKWIATTWVDNYWNSSLQLQFRISIKLTQEHQMEHIGNLTAISFRSLHIKIVGKEMMDKDKNAQFGTEFSSLSVMIL